MAMSDNQQQVKEKNQSGFSECWTNNMAEGVPKYAGDKIEHLECVWSECKEYVGV